jgi:hypothetical protein
MKGLMKTVTTLILLVFFMKPGFTHEAGHGEIEESGKFGGRTAPVVDNIDAEKINEVKPLYKAELVRTEAGKLSLYLFDEKMELMSLDAFANEVEVKLEVKKKGKFIHFGEIKLSKHGNHFMGQLPKVEYKPFNLDMYIMKDKQKLFVGFADLD